jgi:uncharacterized protein (TIGR02217 family)
MPYYLATTADSIRHGWVKRFAPRLWTVDFPRPMMAAVTNPAPALLRVDLEFLTRSDLAGLIWLSEDRWSHPLLKYRTERDYRGCTLAFDWVAGPGMMPLDAVNGPTLTIEGRDALGAPRSWYVRLWNYATGDPFSARIEIPFSRLEGGFALPDDSDPVVAVSIDRLFISLVPEGYDGVGGPFQAPVTTWVELRGVAASGERETIAIGDAHLPDHDRGMTSGYDDSYHVAPERLAEQWQALGYRGAVTHYVGMSHYYALVWDGERHVVDPTKTLNAPAVAWHRALGRSLRPLGLELVLSLSYELFLANAPEAWAQRAHDGSLARTGWDPPSTLLSPANAAAMEWLQSVARALVGVGLEAGLPARFQVGEPWWWVGTSFAPCFYDSATTSAFQTAFGRSPPQIADIRGDRSEEERDFLAWLGGVLATSTAALVVAARDASGGELTSHLLFYSPQVLNEDAPHLRLANMPAEWAMPAFDVLQLEDYDFVIEENEFGLENGWSTVQSALGYPLSRIEYFSGFVLQADDARPLWKRIDRAAHAAVVRGASRALFWAWPQIARDGFTYFRLEEEQDVDAFHDVLFPLELGFEASVGPEFRTEVVEFTSGFEQRNTSWAQARLAFDAGLGVRSEEDLRTILSFFRARRGRAHGFRIRDPLDHASGKLAEGVTPLDESLGVGDGSTMTFPLVKRYGDETYAHLRRITRPLNETIRVAVNGAEQVSGWQATAGGRIRFDAPPPAGVPVTAGFVFDVPVRFAVDRLEISVSGWRSGELPSVPIVEIRENDA